MTEIIPVPRNSHITVLRPTSLGSVFCSVFPNDGLDLAEVDILVFGPEFIGRVEEIADEISKNRLLFYVGENCPSFAEHYDRLTANCASTTPYIELTDEDDAAIYFSSGTTGFPKAILHNHESLMHAARVEQYHHGQT